MYLLLAAVATTMLIYDWTKDKLPAARIRVKIVYALLLALSIYHLLIYKGWLHLPAYYDVINYIYGNSVKQLFTYLNPKG